ncbi:hypothetical protein [Flavobacterium sp.]|uniref:hypothetical protein n=1 Tax=Flavobacterium sp. TaxID=239 RepID=UPI0026357C7C|nr:hypothetical protein [Flavobacterium sp.]
MFLKYLRLFFVTLLILFSLISCSEIVSEEDISDDTLLLTAPVNNAQFVSTSVTFSWEYLQDATKYELQIAKPNFAAPLQIVLDTIVTSNSFSFQLPVGQYQWRVKALNGSYSTLYARRDITILSNDDFQSNTVVLVAPTNNLITNTASQTLSWQSIIGATNYQLQVFDSSNTLVLDQNTSSTTYNYTFAEGSFQWKVKASNGTDNTLYSARSILVDFTPPNTPTLITPANASSTSTTDVSFSWNRTPISGSSERDSIYIYTNSALTTLNSKAQATSPYSKTLTSGTYYWRVKAFDSAGNVGNVSSTFNFTIN